MNTYYGILAGPAFAIAYSIAGIFTGSLSDKYNRKNLLGVACILWSATTLVQGTTNSF